MRSYVRRNRVSNSILWHSFSSSSILRKLESETRLALNMLVDQQAHRIQYCLDCITDRSVHLLSSSRDISFSYVTYQLSKSHAHKKNSCRKSRPGAPFSDSRLHPWSIMHDICTPVSPDPSYQRGRRLSPRQ